MRSDTRAEPSSSHRRRPYRGLSWDKVVILGFGKGAGIAVYAPLLEPRDRRAIFKDNLVNIDTYEFISWSFINQTHANVFKENGRTVELTVGPYMRKVKKCPQSQILSSGEPLLGLPSSAKGRSHSSQVRSVASVADRSWRPSRRAAEATLLKLFPQIKAASETDARSVLETQADFGAEVAWAGQLSVLAITNRDEQTTLLRHAILSWASTSNSRLINQRLGCRQDRTAGF